MDNLLVKRNGEVILCPLLNLRPAQEQAIQLLGSQVKKCDLFGSLSAGEWQKERVKIGTGQGVR